MKAYIQLTEVLLMEQAATCLRDRLLVRLLFHLGCRVSETLALKVQDIDFGQGTVTIMHLKTSFRLSCHYCQARLGRRHSYCPSCGVEVTEQVARAQESRRQRTLPLDAETLVMLGDFIRRDGTKGLIFGINRHRAWQIVKECAQRAGLPPLVNPESGKVHGISPHKLRDAFAIHAVKVDDSGDGLRLLQQHLGHASFNTTAKYRKMSGTEHREWYQKLWHTVEHE